MTPDTLLRLANLTVPRKPGRGPTIYPDALAGTLRELHKTIAELVDGLLSGRPVARPAARLNRLAQPSVATVRLDVGESQTLRARLDWNEPTPTATLARRVALELGEIDVTRLKRCERPACDLVFYDTTRSGTKRWHAESPCGLRERQRRHRAAASTGSPAE